MSEIRAKILEAVSAERDRQIAKWTGKFDDSKYSPMDWYEMIGDYNAWARRMGAMGSPDKQRRRLIQVAALAVAAVEVIDAAAVSKVWCTEACRFARQAMPYDPISCESGDKQDQYCTRPGGPETGEKR